MKPKTITSLTIAALMLNLVGCDKASQPGQAGLSLVGLRSAIRAISDDQYAGPLLELTAEIERSMHKGDKSGTETNLKLLAGKIIGTPQGTIPLEELTAVIEPIVKIQDLYDIPGVIVHEDSCVTDTPPYRECRPEKGKVCYTIEGVQGAAGDSCP